MAPAPRALRSLFVASCGLAYHALGASRQEGCLADAPDGACAAEAAPAARAPRAARQSPGVLLLQTSPGAAALTKEKVPRVREQGEGATPAPAPTTPDPTPAPQETPAPTPAPRERPSPTPSPQTPAPTEATPAPTPEQQAPAPTEAPAEESPAEPPAPAPAPTPAPEEAPTPEEPGPTPPPSGTGVASATEVLELKKKVLDLKRVVEQMQACMSHMQEQLPNRSPECPAVPSSPALPPPLASEPPGLCAIFGDPHFITFDGANTILLADKTVWLVKSERVWVQGWSKERTGNFAGFAISGPFMDGHTLVVLAGGNGQQSGRIVAYYDGEPILEEGAEADYASPDDGATLRASKHKDWVPAIHDSAVLSVKPAIEFAVGPWKSRFQDGPKGGLFFFRLPEGVEVTATGVDFMSAVLKMNAQEKQSGYCGNFNNNATDDFKPAPDGWVPEKLMPAWNWPIGEGLEGVANSENLFKSVGDAATASLEVDSPLTPRAPKSSFQPCPEELKKQAEAECVGLPDLHMRLACYIDVCETGRIEAADGVVDAEILESFVNARGIPVFIGHGKCRGSTGAAFTAIKTKQLSTSETCVGFLRECGTSVAGVLGAQLEVNSTCEILLPAYGTDKDGKPVPFDASKIPTPTGGWAEAAYAAVRRGNSGAGGGAEGDNGTSSGVSYVDGIDEELASWSCWRLN